jgi:DNA invertase Pin-like site-specific DNA recombinase
MSGQLLGYARVSTTHQSNDQQEDALLAAGVDQERIYVDKLTGASRREDRPGWGLCWTMPARATSSW